MDAYDIISAAAAYLEKAPDDFVINDVDLGLAALNQSRLEAELGNDFNFTRKLLTLDVDGVSGGSLDDAVEYGTDVKWAIKTVVDVGLFDSSGNFTPVEWTTVSDSLNRQRNDNAYTFRYPTDSQAVCGPLGQNRFLFSGNKVMVFPKTLNTTFSLAIEAYTFTPDWCDTDFTPTDDNTVVWFSKGSKYLQWSAVIYLNNLFKQFVFRQEGNLAPPQAMADQGLATLVTWDNFKYEQFRRHSR